LLLEEVRHHLADNRISCHEDLWKVDWSADGSADTIVIAGGATTVQLNQCDDGEYDWRTLVLELTQRAARPPHPRRCKIAKKLKNRSVWLG